MKEKNKNTYCHVGEANWLVSETNNIKETNNEYLTTILIKLSSDKNKLSDIVSKICIPKVHISSIENIDNLNYKATIKVNDKSQIDLVIKNVHKLRYVKEVKRVWKL